MILVQAIALGLIISLYTAEYLGLLAGGLVVPGYFVVISSRPMMLLATILASLLALGILKLLSSFMLLYGRRRLLVAVLIGFILAQLSREVVNVYPHPVLMQLQAFGFIIPGLLAYWMDKQGILPTLGMLAINVTIVRFILIILHGGQEVL